MKRLVLLLVVLTPFSLAVADVPNGTHSCKTPLSSPEAYSYWPPGYISLTMKDEYGEPLPTIGGHHYIRKGKWCIIEASYGLDWDWRDGEACCSLPEPYCHCTYGKLPYTLMGNYDAQFSWSFAHQMLLNKKYPTADEELGYLTCENNRVRCRSWCWIQVPVIFGVPYGSPITVTCSRQGASTYPDGNPTSAVLEFYVTSFQPPVVTLSAASTCVSQANHTSALESALLWAGLHTLNDADGPTRFFDHDGNGYFAPPAGFPNNPQRGMWDTSINKTFALAPGGVVQLYPPNPPNPPCPPTPGSCKDLVCSPVRPGFCDDMWAFQSTYHIIVSTKVHYWYPGADVTNPPPANGLGCKYHIVLRESGGLMWDVFLHEYGHWVGLTHVYPLMTDENYENTSEGYTKNMMKIPVVACPGWFSSRMMITDIDKTCQNPTPGPAQWQTSGW